MQQLRQPRGDDLSVYMGTPFLSIFLPSTYVPVRLSSSVLDSTGWGRLPEADRPLVLLAPVGDTAELQLDRGKRNPEKQGHVRVLGPAQLQRWVSWRSPN